MKVAYILSMATSGVAAWNYREIDILQQHGVDIFAYPLKWTEGPYMPRDGWYFRKPNCIRTLLRQPIALVKWRLRYLSLFIQAIRHRAPLEFLLAADYSQEMAQYGIQHIHCHFGDRKLYTGYFCGKLLDLTFTVTVHAYEILKNPNPTMFKLAASAAKVIVVQSEFNKSEVMRVFDIPEEKFRVIRAHGDLSEQSSKGKLKLFIAAEFRHKKGHEVLFAALKKLQRGDIVLWVAGRGKLDIRKLAEDMGVSDQVVFLGSVGRDIINILFDACDVFVLPSRTSPDGDREGIPAAIMEAMSHGKSVISTVHTGIPELLPETLVPENDAEALAAAIAFLADHPEERARQGQQNLEIIKRDYGEPAVLKLKELFAECIEA